jgi:flagellar biosynthetic protein FliQ
MNPTLVDLYLFALEIAALVVLPVVGLVATVGIIVGLAQSITGISDQNLSFGPKIIAVAVLAVFGGATALALLQMLALEAIHALPYLAR